MCLYPKLIRNRKYIPNKKNGGIVPEVKDVRVLSVPVGCGKCLECKKQKSREWAVRLQEDIRVNKNAKFMTLTFNDDELRKLESEIKGLEGYDLDNEVCRLAVRRFTENWRKKFKKTIRHWLVTEIGGNNTERIHMHGIFWINDILKSKKDGKVIIPKREIYNNGRQETIKSYNKRLEVWNKYVNEQINEKWKYGNIYIGEYVNEQTINYIVKYINKVDEKHKEYNSKIFTSKGIGANYMLRNDIQRNKYKEGGKTIETYATRQGIELALPIYYRNKIYTDDQKELLWLEKLDKQIRYVDGVEVSIKDGEEEYYKLLELKRKKNKRLGFGDDEENWELKRYENERRALKKIDRLEKEIGKAHADMLRSRVSLFKSIDW